MYGIDMNKPIIFRHASMRYFEVGEHHVNRVLPYDVLLLVYDGVLRFSEDGIEYEVTPGHYHLQKAHTLQKGTLVSDKPSYFYVHFNAEWADTAYTLPKLGDFSYSQLKNKIENLDKIAHSDFSYTEKTCLFYEILCTLNNNNTNNNTNNTASEIRSYITSNFLGEISLDDICRTFSYSKNHIINIFKAEYQMTPLEYINDLKLKKAMHLLESTSDSAESIAMECGFNCYSHFYKLFQKKTGFSPAKWRKKIAGKPSLLYNLYL